MATANPAPPNLSLLLGPMLMAEFMNWGLFGVLTVQLYIYYLAFPNDRIYGKTLVGLIYILEIMQLAVTTHDAFIAYAAQWGDFAHVDGVKTLWLGIPVLTGIIGCLVQLFYAWRIHKLGRNVWVSGVVSLSALPPLGFSIWNGVEIHRVADLQDLSHASSFPTVIAWLTATALCDILITLSMSYYLLKAKKSSSVRRTAAMLSRLIKYTVETGLFTATFAIIELILFVALPDTLLYTLLMGITPKLYSNCLLALFNSRIQVENGRITDSDRIIFMSTIGASSQNGPSTDLIRSPNTLRNGITIQIAKTSDSVADSESLRVTSELDKRCKMALEVDVSAQDSGV
ncbi:hypothetical protein EIP91_009422 [Steccherinum ochraceum]|uniref:DUF6534 domain-containing protein n=1 Tax=Steccherinum ochraceum TaxID=92696 RepID=A0A4R0R4B0_9APHY|nr:hypothetical protein EIP91_009422 [Steccherinum ochraceum]